MSSWTARYCEKIVRNHIPFICRSSFVYFVIFIYLILQPYVCHMIKKWRKAMREKNVVVIPAFVANETMNNVTSFDNTTITNSANMTNLTTSFIEQIPANFSMNSTLLKGAKVIIEDPPTLCAHAFVIFLFFLGILIVLNLFSLKEEILFRQAATVINWISYKDLFDCRDYRYTYNRQLRTLNSFDRSMLTSTLTLRERNLLSRLWHRTYMHWDPSVKRFGLMNPSIDCTLVDYICCDLDKTSEYQIFGAIEIVYEVMKAMDYLHYRNTYHLDLKPESVKLFCNGRKVYVKLGNFNFMKKSMNKKILSSSVGMKGLYKPLECSVEQEVDPEKIDTWGLGMIALEIFTGGMFRLRSFSRKWKHDNVEELIRKMLQRSPFMGYLEATYGLLTMFQDARYHATTYFEFKWYADGKKRPEWDIVTCYPYRNYEVNHETFMSDIRSFVYRLLVFSPRRRMSLPRAFQEPLILNRRVENK